MKVARFVMFSFAIVTIALMLQRWKKQDRESARNELITTFNVQVERFGDETHLLVTHPKVTDLRRLSELIKRAETRKDGSPLQPAVLDLTGNPNLVSLEGTSNFHSLRSINVVDCPQLRSANGLTGLPLLIEVRLTHNPQLVDVSAIRDLPSLITVDLSACGLIESIDSLEGLPDLRNLYLSSCRNLTQLDLSRFPKLEQLYLDSCSKLVEIEGLSSLTQLTDLDISNCHGITTLDGLENLKSLQVFDLRSVELEDFSIIGKLPNLMTLRLGGQADLTSLLPFAPLSSLQEIHLEACPQLASLEGMPKSVEQYAGFVRCNSLKTLDGIESAQELKVLDMSYSENLEDISAIASLKNLAQLSLVGCELITDVDQLVENTQLKFVRLGGSGVTPAKLETLKKALKETIFDFNDMD